MGNPNYNEEVVKSWDALANQAESTESSEANQVADVTVEASVTTEDKANDEAAR